MSVDEALSYILEHVSVLDAEDTPIVDALDRVLAQDVVSDMDVPPFTNSAMDGYAVRAGDVVGAEEGRPVRLAVAGCVAAGEEPGCEALPGTAVRIMTGAPMPPGADAVVRFEETSEGRSGAFDEESVEVYCAVRQGDNVRRAGEDVKEGQVVIPAGRVVRPQEVGVMAALGKARAKVFRRPRVAILATGDELVEIEEPLAPGKIRNSNEYTSAAQVLRCGGVPVQLGIARDSIDDLLAKVERGLSLSVDLFLTSAGVSIGDFDVVKDVLARKGEVAFWQVAIKPGKPLAFGFVDNVPLLGLPGNPVAAMIAFEVFARPALLKMQGRADWGRPSVRARLKEDVRNSARRHFMRAVLSREEGGYVVSTRGSGVNVQGSGILSSLVWANALAIIPENVTFIPAGSEVEVWTLD